MATISLDLRERIIKACDRGDETRPQIARRFEVSLGMVKKLLDQRRRLGTIAALHHRSGRKPVILDSHRRQIRELLKETPDLTLEEIKARTDLTCTIQAIHYVLASMGMTYKKRRSVPRNNPVPTWPAPAATGVKSKKASNPPASSFLMNRRRKPT